MFVGPNTEETFNDPFWMKLDGVCNALDNMEARLYVDKQCVRYEKSLLESGTMGTSGNTDTISPFQTRTYSDGGAAVEGGGVPMCTLRNFPHLTDHCIEWARDQFELFFVKLPKSVQRYIDEPDAFEREKRTLADAEPGQALFETRCVQSLLAAARTPTVGTAAQVAFDLFHFLFRDKIVDLQTAFPKDYRMVDKETGADKGPFWSEKKRYPTAAKFDGSDEVPPSPPPRSHLPLDHSTHRAVS
jgi:ubiquitin-activating enzyme E1